MQMHSKSGNYPQGRAVCVSARNFVFADFLFTTLEIPNFVDALMDDGIILNLAVNDVNQSGRSLPVKKGGRWIDRSVKLSASLC